MKDCKITKFDRKTDGERTIKNWKIAGPEKRKTKNE